MPYALCGLHLPGTLPCRQVEALYPHIEIEVVS